MSRNQRTNEELLLDMRRESEEPWRYYYYGREPRKIMLPIRVTEQERDAIRAAAKWENKKVSEFIRAAIAGTRGRRLLQGERQVSRSISSAPMAVEIARRGEWPGETLAFVRPCPPHRWIEYFVPRIGNLQARRNTEASSARKCGVRR